MNKKQKMLIGGASVSAIVTGVALTGGTSAFYYDLEQQTGNSIEACDFDLEQSVTTVKTTTGTPAPTQSTVGNQPGAITISNVEPGDTFRSTITLSNVGSCAGDLWADIDEHTDNENTRTEPESSEGGDTTDNVGELGDYMRVSVSRDGTPLNGLQDVTLASLATLLPSNVDTDFGTDSTDLVLEFVAPVNGNNPAGRADENAIMTDSYTFVLDFALAQRGHMPNQPGDLSTLS